MIASIHIFMKHVRSESMQYAVYTLYSRKDVDTLINMPEKPCVLSLVFMQCGTSVHISFNDEKFCVSTGR